LSIPLLELLGAILEVLFKKLDIIQPSPVPLPAKAEPKIQKIRQLHGKKTNKD
jgi:hypothetical protein